VRAVFLQFALCPVSEQKVCMTEEGMPSRFT